MATLQIRPARSLNWWCPILLSKTRVSEHMHCPVLFFGRKARKTTLKTLLCLLFFLDALAFCFARKSSFILSVFLYFPGILGVRPRKESLHLWWVLLAFFQKGQERKIRSGHQKKTRNVIPTEHIRDPWKRRQKNNLSCTV